VICDLWFVVVVMMMFLGPSSPLAAGRRLESCGERSGKISDHVTTVRDNQEGTFVPVVHDLSRSPYQL
jgi:hypothetical protein